MIKIDKKEHKTFGKTKQTDDSKTKVYQKLHGLRDVVSIRCKPELKEALKRFCMANGLSICHICEMLTTGYLVGMKQKIDWVNQSPTIELSVVRETKRVRRYAREFVVESNKYVSNMWIYEADSVLNVNGHAIGCECKICLTSNNHVPMKVDS